MAETQPVLTPEQRAAIIDQWERTFARYGIDMYDGAQRLVPWVELGLRHIVAAQSRETLNDFLSEATVETSDRVNLMIAWISALGPAVEGFLSDAVRNAAADLPRPVGPRPKLDLSTRRIVVQEVRRLWTNDVPLGIAHSRIAARHGISKRSVERVWRDRKKIGAQVFNSLDEMIGFLLHSGHIG